MKTEAKKTEARKTGDCVPKRVAVLVQTASVSTVSVFIAYVFIAYVSLASVFSASVFFAYVFTTLLTASGPRVTSDITRVAGTTVGRATNTRSQRADW
jgi:hypothetical protein